jgi:glycosyltransferase involved in cell wall biosynthesis
MPEVAGDAALLVNPDDVSSISNAMSMLARDAELRSELSAKGILRATKFSWEEAADQFWKSIEKTVSR